MNKLLIFTGVIVLAALLAAGSFWGGMAYQSKADETAASQARATFLNERGQLDGEQLPNNGQGPAGAQPPSAFGGRGTTGVVKTIDGDVLTISTALDVTTVQLSADTQVEKFELGSTADLQPGMRVMVSGETGSDESITASQITILNTNAGDLPAGLEPPVPSAAGTEP